MYRSVLHFRNYFLQTCILQLITEFSIDYSIGYSIWLARYHIRFNSRSCGYSSVPGRLFFLHSTYSYCTKNQILDPHRVFLLLLYATIKKQGANRGSDFNQIDCTKKVSRTLSPIYRFLIIVFTWTALDSRASILLGVTLKFFF